MTDSVQPQTTPKKKRYRVPLDSLARLRAEMAKVYREARGGVTSLSDMTRLVYALDRMARLAVDVELERRIEVLEAQTALPALEHPPDSPTDL